MEKLKRLFLEDPSQKKGPKNRKWRWKKSQPLGSRGANDVFACYRKITTVSHSPIIKVVCP